MELSTTILLFMGMLLVAAVLQPLSRWFHLPYTLTLVIAGFVGSEIITSYGIDTGLRWHHFHAIIFYLFLPALIFSSAIKINLKSLLKKLIPILLLSMPMMLTATFVTAGLIFWGIGYPSYFPWMAALLTGALLSATDPAAVIALFKQAGVSEEMILLIEGESLFNDAIAILLFGLFTSLLIMPGELFSFTYAVERFGLVFFGGVLTGFIVLLLLMPIFLKIHDRFARMTIMICAAYGSYLLGESVLHVSGVMAVLVVGLGFGELLRKLDATETEKLSTLWEFNGQMAEALIFILLGVTITLGMFQQQWLAMLLGIGAVLLARLCGLLITLPVINLFPGTQVDLREGAVLYWGGVKGAVTIALALSLPLELESWFTIQSIAYGVVLFSICIQSVTTPVLIKSINLKGTNL